MPYDPKKHHRRSIRWYGYDYTHPGWYFVTVCAQGHVCLFGHVGNGHMQLNDAGRMVQQVWVELTDHYPRAQTDAFVVMPNHIHGIIELTDVRAGPCPDHAERLDNRHSDIANAGFDNSKPGQPRGVAPTGLVLSLADVVHRFKTLATKRYIDGVNQYDWPAFPGRLWQRNYHEHVIRSERALARIRQYITDNPARWPEDPENPNSGQR